MKPTLKPLLNIFILLVSSSMVLYFSYQIFQSVNLKYFSSKTKGNITGYYTKNKNAHFAFNRNPVYAPTFTFIDKNDEQFNIITTTYKKEMKYKKGDSIIIFYNTKNPQLAQINDTFPWTRLFIMLITGLAGIFFTISPFWNFIKQ